VYFSTSGRTPAPSERIDSPPVEATPPPTPPAALPAATPVTAAPPARIAPLAAAARLGTPPAGVAPRAAPPPPGESSAARPPRPAATSPVAAERPAPDEAQPGEVARLTVGLLVVRPCWLSATVDGEKRIERLLQPGERQTIEVTRELSFTAGDASAVKMTINGADARPLGKEGEVVTARVNATNFRSYLLQR
jgi:cytoskeletal protein RodZ